jgi:hypothetical protein
MNIILYNETVWLIFKKGELGSLLSLFLPPTPGLFPSPPRMRVDNTRENFRHAETKPKLL